MYYYYFLNLCQKVKSAIKKKSKEKKNEDKLRLLKPKNPKNDFLAGKTRFFLMNDKNGQTCSNQESKD